MPVAFEKNWALCTSPNGRNNQILYGPDLGAGWVPTLALMRLLMLRMFGAMPATESTRSRHALAMLVLALLLLCHVSTFPDYHIR